MTLETWSRQPGPRPVPEPPRGLAGVTFPAVRPRRGKLLAAAIAAISSMYSCSTSAFASAEPGVAVDPFLSISDS